MADLLARITATPLDVMTVNGAVWGPSHGAVVLFTGVVRDHDGGQSVSALEYEAHPEAERFLIACCAEVSEKTGLPVAAMHRTGHLVVGDVALVAAVASAHRAQAFDACAELVERIKAEVPIWKKQHFSHGASEWVGL